MAILEFTGNCIWIMSLLELLHFVAAQEKNKYSREDRTCTCANKDNVRLYSKNRTAGWQFVIDPHSRHVVAAHEHIVNESLKDKVETIMAAMTLPKVKPDLLIHDDACHFEAPHQEKMQILQAHDPCLQVYQVLCG